MQINVSTIVVAWGVLSGAWATADEPIDFKAAELEQVVREELEETRSPGAAVAIVQGDRIALATGFGVASVETGEKVTAESLFRLGSTTKMLCFL